MKKKICCYWVFGVLMSICSSGFAQLISDKNEINVKTEDADRYLQPAPVQAQIGLLKNKKGLVDRLEQLYLSKAISEQQKKIPLKEDEQAELDRITANFYLQRKIRELSTDNLPAFEPYAKLQYEANKADYMNPEMVAAEHILISTKKYSEKEATKIANDLIAKLKKGADFAELADKYSDDPSVTSNHGKLGLFGRRVMFKDFEDAAFNLKLNEISQPVLTDFGVHIIRKYEHQKASQKTFDEVKQELIEKQKNEYVQKRLGDYFAELKKSNAMKLDDVAIDAFIAEKLKKLGATPAAAAPAENNHSPDVGK